MAIINSTPKIRISRASRSCRSRFPAWLPRDSTNRERHLFTASMRKTDFAHSFRLWGSRQGGIGGIRQAARFLPLIKSMKNTLLHLTGAAVLAFAIIGSGHRMLGQASVQTVTTGQGGVQATTITSAGTISQFSPDSIVVKTENSAEPVHYTYSKTTTYVDENGNPVSMETVKSGLPVTVYYVKDGDNLVASKVIVRRAVVVAPATTTDK